MANKIWINMLTADRDDVENVFLHQREKLVKEFIQLRVEIASANENRFADNPIEIGLLPDMQAMYAKFDALSRDAQNEFLAELFEN